MRKTTHDNKSQENKSQEKIIHDAALKSDYQEALNKNPPQRMNPKEVLTARGYAIFQLLKKGYSAKNIGMILGISRRTVNYHTHEMHKIAGGSTTVDCINVFCVVVDNE